MRLDWCMTVPVYKAPANYVPGAALIGSEQAMAGITGLKGRGGGFLGQASIPWAQPGDCT